MVSTSVQSQHQPDTFSHYQFLLDHVDQLRVPHISCFYICNKAWEQNSCNFLWPAEIVMIKLMLWPAAVCEAKFKAKLSSYPFFFDMKLWNILLLHNHGKQGSTFVIKQTHNFQKLKVYSSTLLHTHLYSVQVWVKTKKKMYFSFIMFIWILRK